MDDEKIKRTFYLTPEANTALNQFVLFCSTNSSTYGKTSETVNDAIIHYTDFTMLPQSEQFPKPQCFGSEAKGFCSCDLIQECIEKYKRGENRECATK